MQIFWLIYLFLISSKCFGRNHRSKHVELIGIINKPLMLYLVGCLYYYISDARTNKYQTAPGSKQVQGYS